MEQSLSHVTNYLSMHLAKWTELVGDIEKKCDNLESLSAGIYLMVDHWQQKNYYKSMPLLYNYCDEVSANETWFMNYSINYNVSCCAYVTSSTVVPLVDSPTSL